MAIRRRCFAPLVALLTVAYLVSSIGCATARVRPSAGQQPLRLQSEQAANIPAANAVSHAAATSDVTLASYEEHSRLAQQPLLSATPDDLAAGQIDIDQIVRGQDDHGYGPIKEFLWSPYTIGVLFVAALVIPAAFKGAEDEAPVIP